MSRLDTRWCENTRITWIRRAAEGGSNERCPAASEREGGPFRITFRCIFQGVMRLIPCVASPSNPQSAFSG